MSKTLARLNRKSTGKALFSLGCLTLTIILLFMVEMVACETVEKTGHPGQASLSPNSGFISAYSPSPFRDRRLLGLFTESVSEILMKKVPRSEWKYIRNLRLFAKWSELNPKRNVYNWVPLDKEVKNAVKLGINGIMLTVTGPVPKWAVNPKNPGDRKMGPPKDMKYWKEFCKQLARRYRGKIDYFQIWQEPGWDLDSPVHHVYYSSYCDYTYMGLLRAGYQGIKSGNPDAYVASGSLMNGLTRNPSSFYNYEILMAGRNQDLAMVVEAEGEIVAERPMYFNYGGKWAGGHVEMGVKEANTVWYLAEGATHPGFEEWICIQNPGKKNAKVTITYMFPGGSTQTQQVTVIPNSRYTVDVNRAVGPYKDVSAKLSSDQPIIVERPMYFDYHNSWPGGSVDSGITEPGKVWYLAEGATHPGFEQWISLMNPNDITVKVDLTYMFPGGATQQQRIYMPPTSRETILVNNVVGPYKDVSTKIVASRPIIAERPMYFIYHGKWRGGHTQVGTRKPELSWFFAEGTTRYDPQGTAFEEWISLQNPGDKSANVRLTYMFEGGGTQVQTLTIPPHARETVLVNNIVGPERDVSVQVDSDVPIVAERPMYFNYGGMDGGHVELGCRKPSRKWYFAEGTTRVGFDEWLTLQNPAGNDVRARITFMFSDGTTQVKWVRLPAKSRTTVFVNLSVSLGTICDGIAVHPYDYPQHWAWYYSYVVQLAGRYGFGNKEIICSEIGWPNGVRPEFSVEGQRQAIGEVGIGGLIRAGCQKIWVFQDVDAPPGTSPDGDYYGLFNFYGRPYPAWNEYKKWQATFPDYGNKPVN